MNQQRSRRFKAGKEREEAEHKARRLGEDIPSQGLFDSNCITPGTPFMVRLDNHLKFFIRSKMAKDTAWKHLKIVYSGYDVPGEGEHKIMEYIRFQKVQGSSISPNLRHCLYGLDADLILLALATHEPHFCLLREVVSYNSISKGQPSREVLNMEKDEFLLLHIGILREYLKEETHVEDISGVYDLERVIDDFVLLCVLVGNDFLPHSPTLDINEGAMDEIFDCYRDMLRTKGGYLTYGEGISHVRLEFFLTQVARRESDTLKQRAQDQIDFEQRRSRGGPVPTVADHQGGDNSAGDDGNLYSDQATMMTEEARTLILAGDTVAGLEAYKKRMYRKMQAHAPEEVRSIVKWYMQGLHWVMQYYYRGVPSWDWYFPYHYAPFLSDMIDLNSISCEFNQGSPVLPLHQLLMVLPPTSKNLLPEVLQPLMLDPNSPIADFYPDNFCVDGEGKRADWEAVVLLPFVDMARLVGAYQQLEDKLPTDVKASSKTGKMYIFVHVQGHHEPAFCQSTLPGIMDNVTMAHSKAEALGPKKPLHPEVLGFTPAITQMQGCLYEKDAPQVGWPTLQLFSFCTELKAVNVNVLGITSRKKTRIVVPQDEVALAEEAGSRLAGRMCFANFPHISRAKVLAVTDGVDFWEMRGSEVSRKGVGSAQLDILTSALADSKRTLLQKQGIDASAFSIFAKALLVTGKERQVGGAMLYKLSETPQYFPAALVFARHPGGASLEAPLNEVAAPLSVGDRLIYRGLAYYGYIATVTAINVEDGTYEVEITGKSINFKAATSRICHAVAACDRSLVWLPNYVVARKMGIDSSALGRITAACRVTVGQQSFDVGVSVRHGNDLCVPGISRPSPEGKGWQYSAKAVEVLMLYHAKFPWIAQLCAESDSATLLLADAFPGASNEELIEKAKGVQRWRQQSSLAECKLVPVTSDMPQDSAMHTVEAIIGAISCSPVKTLELHSVRPELLLAPLSAGVTSPVSARSVHVGDWVACMSTDGGPTPPFGAYGVVVAVHDGFADIRTLEKFPGGSDLDGRVQKCYGSRLPFHYLLSLTNISCPDASQLASPALSARAVVPQAGKTPSRSSTAAVPAAAVAEPAIPDGTRGFHQHMGHGRGKPVQQASAKATIATLAGPQQPERPPHHIPAPAATAGVPEIPEFFQKLLRAPTDRNVKPPQAPAVAQPSARQDGAPEGQNVGAADEPQQVPDFLKKLLGKPLVQSNEPHESRAQPSMLQAPADQGHILADSNGARPLELLQPQVQVPSGPPLQAAPVPLVGIPSAELPPARSASISAAPALSQLQRLSPTSHEEFTRLTRQQQMQTALESMKDLLSVLQSVSQSASNRGHHTLANVLAKDLATQSLSLDMINSIEDAICELTGGLDITEDDMEILASSAQQIFDQARHAVEDAAHPGLQWLQQRILMLISKVEVRCLAVISHAGDDVSKTLHPLRTQLCDVRLGLLPITPQLVETCERLLLPAMAACPSFRVRVMLQQTQTNIANIRNLREELLADVSQMLHEGAGKLLGGCHAMLKAGITSVEMMAPVQKTLADAYASRHFTRGTINASRSFFQDLANRRVGNSNEMLQELSHQDMLLTILDRYSVDRTAPVQSSTHVPSALHQAAATAPSVLIQPTSHAHAGAGPSGAQLALPASADGRSQTSRHLAVVPVARTGLVAAQAASLTTVGYPSASLQQPVVGASTVAPKQAAQAVPSGGKSAQDWAGEDLIRGLLQNVTRHPAQAALAPTPTQLPHGHGPSPPVQQMHKNHALRATVIPHPHPSAVHAGRSSQNPYSASPSPGHVDPLEMWSLLREGR